MDTPDRQSSTALDSSVEQKVRAAQAILRELGSVVVAFSGGVDSTYLLALAAQTLGRQKALAVISVSPSLAARERQEASELAGRIGVELVEIQTREMDDPRFAANPADRCFYCKSELFTHLKDLAARRGLSAVASGANADDVGDFRPGHRAGRQLGVRSPLMEAGMTKQDIRAASKALGLPTWNKPAMACLASRLPYGEPITPEKLSRIEKAEYVLKDLGFSQCRVRDHQTVARIEVPASEFAAAMDKRATIIESLKALGYTYVALDLEGFRSGSMNETLRR